MFRAFVNGQQGPERKTPLGAVKAAVKNVPGPHRVEIEEDGMPLAVVHGTDENNTIEKTREMFARNRRRY